jgi:hypothetical protein
MIRIRLGVLILLGLAVFQVVSDADTTPRTAKQALQTFNDIIGTWKGTGEPKGPKVEKGDFWIETMDWEWQFKGQDAWLKVVFQKSRHFVGGELRYVPGKDHFELTLKTPKKETISFIGEVNERVATFTRQMKDNETQRVVFTLLHANRFLYRYDTRAAGKTLFTTHYRVGATKEGVPFAGGDGRPECVVSGGLGTISVSYKGQTYYVCCSGCRVEFNENPEKYIKEFNDKKAKSKN